MSSAIQNPHIGIRYERTASKFWMFIRFNHWCQKLTPNLLVQKLGHITTEIFENEFWTTLMAFLSLVCFLLNRCTILRFKRITFMRVMKVMREIRLKIWFKVMIWEHHLPLQLCFSIGHMHKLFQSSSSSSQSFPIYKLQFLCCYFVPFLSLFSIRFLCYCLLCDPFLSNFYLPLSLPFSFFHSFISLEFLNPLCFRSISSSFSFQKMSASSVPAPLISSVNVIPDTVVVYIDVRDSLNALLANYLACDVVNLQPDDLSHYPFQ